MQIPKNVVQAGDVDSCHKIYIEDYVHTYLSQCRDTGRTADFCLYGKTEKEGDVRYYFIYGAAKEGPGWEITARRYFAKQSRIGEVTYDDKEAWLFFEDGYAAPLEGYFIFYEQNEDMQSYLIAVHQNQPGETVQEVVPRASSRSFERKTRGGQARDNIMGNRTEDNPVGIPETEPSAQEPRRILRMPRSYDIDSPEKWEDSEKIMQAAEAPDLGRPDSRAYERKPSFGRRSLFGNPASGYPGSKSADAKSTDSRYQDNQNAGNSYSHGRNAASETSDGRNPARRKSGSSNQENRRIGIGRPETGRTGTGRPETRRSEIRNRDGSQPRNPNGSSSSILSRAAGLLILLVLSGIGVTSINRYNDMKEAGNLFADAARQPETETSEYALADSALQIEEKQASLPDSGNPVQTPNTDASAQASADASASVTDASQSAAAVSVTDPSSIDPAAITQAGSSQTDTSQTGTSRTGASQTASGQADIKPKGEAQQTDSLPAMSSSVSSAGQDGQAAADTSSMDNTSVTDNTSGKNAQAVQQAQAEQTPSPNKEQTPDENKDAAQPASDITSEAVAASAPVPSSYTVKSGDNLANICRHFYGNLDKMDEICELNSISDPNRLAAGQKIILPK